MGTKLLAVVSELNSRGIIMSLPNGMKGLVSYPESFDMAPEGKVCFVVGRVQFCVCCLTSL